MGYIKLSIAIITGVVSNIVWSEVAGRAPRISMLFVSWAAKQLPRKFRARYEEEWTADLLDYSTPMSQLLFSAGLLVAGRRIMAMERRRLRAIIVQRRIRSAANFQTEYAEELKDLRFYLSVRGAGIAISFSAVASWLTISAINSPSRTFSFVVSMLKTAKRR